ncbi:MAG: cob(I)yrinic acid a,c-diamide adenosyltransferase [Clostridium sp.]|nr:cob(I)yrinic acid a,c-diamide adenosyltransferase [Clostridium sp.]
MTESMNCVHIYCGDGKGKTTAAVGLAVRMQGCGYPVVIARFLKTDDSGEVRTLEKLPGITVIPCRKSFGFTWQMTAEQKKEAACYYTELFEEAVSLAREACAGKEQALLILDEIVAAAGNRFVEEERVVDFLKKRPYNLEIVLTGRNPSDRMIETADYVSEILCRKHPFEKGTGARRGIEF